MEYRIKNEGSKVKVKITSDLTFDDHGDFRTILNTLNEGECDQFFMDMRNVEFIDSAGLGMLLLLHETANEKKVDVTINTSAGQVSRMLELAKFNSMFTIITGN